MTPDELLAIETQKFVEWAEPQGYVNNDANAMVLAKWLNDRNYPMTCDSLVSAFSQSKDQLEFTKTEPKRQPPMNSSGYIGQGNTHSATRASTEKGPMEQLRDTARTLFENVGKVAADQRANANKPEPRMIPLPENPTKAELRAASVEQLREFSRRVSYTDRMKYLYEKDHGGNQ